MSILEKLDNWLNKQGIRIYLKPGERPPEGYFVREGKRGGMYYYATKRPEKKKGRPQKEVATEVNKLQNNFMGARKKWHDLLAVRVKLQQLDKEFPSQRNKDMLKQMNKRVDEARKNQRDLYDQFKQKTAKEKPLEGDIETPREREMFSSEIREKEMLGGGCNETFKVIYLDGRKGCFKPVSGEREGLRDAVHAGTCYKREVAAFKLSRILGFDCCPTTVARNYGGEMGSIQDWVEDGETISVTNKDWQHNPKLQDDIEDLALYNILLGNSDRHGSNAMIDKNDKLWAIDNGLTFPLNDDDGGISIFVRRVEGNDIPSRLKVKLNELNKNWDNVEKKLGKYIEPDALNGVYNRMSEMLASGKFKVSLAKWGW